MEFLKVKDVKPKDLDGISADQIDQHWALYTKYVEQVNYLVQIENSLKTDKTNKVLNNYRTDLVKQISFERNGVFLHELYFQNLKAGTTCDPDGKFSKLVEASFSSFDDYLEDLKIITTTRGENWVITVYDMEMLQLRNVVIDSHEHFVMYQNVPLLAVDCWTHSFAIDFDITEKLKYIDTFMKNINWDIVEDRSSKL